MSRMRLVLVTILLVLAQSLCAATLDLGGRIFYIRRGFDQALVSRMPIAANQGWTTILAEAGRSLAVRDLGFPGVTRPSLLDFARRPSEEFTIACVFEADLALINTTGLSLLVPMAGQGWTAYLNGVAFRSELYTGAAGEPDPQRSLRNTVIPIDKRDLRNGRNVLAFRIVGDPLDERTGLPGGKSLVLGSYVKLATRGGEFLDIALIGIYALFALYHLVLFAFRPKNRSYLIYGAGAILFSVYLFARSRTAAGIITDTTVLRIIEYSALFTVIPLFLAFCESALGRRVSILARLYFALGLILAAFLPFARTEALKLVWEILTAFELAYAFAFVLGPGLIAQYRSQKARAWQRLMRALATDSGLLFLGTFVVAATSVIDVLAVNGGGDMRFTKYAFLAYVVGAGAILAGQFNQVYSELADLRVSLERKVAERNVELEEAVERQKRIGSEIEHQSRRLTDARDMAERDLLMAEKVQRGFFPAKSPLTADWDIAMVFRPASRISGDFFDFFVGEGEEGPSLDGLVIGDVSGRGMGPGLVSVLARSVISRRWPSLRGQGLGQAMAELNRELSGELGGVDEFLTCILLRMEGGKVEYANAAHSDLLYRRAGAAKAIALLPKGQEPFKGPPLGKEGFEGGWAGLRFTPAPGDILLAVTDGLESARDGAGQAFGKDRLLEALGRAEGGGAQAILDAVLAEVEAYVGAKGFEDDMTALLLVRK